MEAASDAFAVDAGEIGDAPLIDVRRAAVYADAPSVIPGAAWRDPAHVAEWARELPAGAPVILYCVRGHEVSRAAVLRLRASGRDARHLRGGIEGWLGAGRPVQPKGELP